MDNIRIETTAIANELTKISAAAPRKENYIKLISPIALDALFYEVEALRSTAPDLDRIREAIYSKGERGKFYEPKAV